MKAPAISPAVLTAAAGVAVVGVVLYLLRNFDFKNGAAAAVGAVADAASGAVVGIGRAVGIPETNASECQQAIAEGRTWDASFACPAGTWLQSLFATRYDFTTPDYPGGAGYPARIEAPIGFNNNPWIPDYLKPQTGLSPYIARS